MMIIMARLIAESSERVLVEPYGTFDDYYDTPNEDMRSWVAKKKISTINDEYVVDTKDPIELAVSEKTGERLL